VPDSLALRNHPFSAPKRPGQRTFCLKVLTPCFISFVIVNVGILLAKLDRSSYMYRCLSLSCHYRFPCTPVVPTDLYFSIIAYRYTKEQRTKTLRAFHSVFFFFFLTVKTFTAEDSPGSGRLVPALGSNGALLTWMDR
jgi:hypothetical protein